MTRRAMNLGAAAAALMPAGPSFAKDEAVRWGPFAGMSTADMNALEASSLDPFAGTLLTSDKFPGVRVIDLVQGTGPEAKKGTPTRTLVARVASAHSTSV